MAQNKRAIATALSIFDKTNNYYKEGFPVGYDRSDRVGRGIFFAKNHF
jgi:hypothetical protein